MNLLEWIKEHRIFASIAAVIAALAIIISASYITGGGTTAAGRLIQSGVAAVTSKLTEAGSTVGDNVHGLFSYKELLAENEELRDENAELQRQVNRLRLTESELAELRSLAGALNYRGDEGGDNVVAADITSVDGTKWFNLFTINAGTESGVEKNSVVVSGDGLVGRVVESGYGSAKVVGIIDESNSVSFEVFRDLTLMGVLSGDGSGMLAGYMFDSEATVIVGDVLITSKLGMYPEGIEIGTVEAVEYNEDTQLRMVTVRPSVTFKKLKKVAVIV